MAPVSAGLVVDKDRARYFESPRVLVAIADGVGNSAAVEGPVVFEPAACDDHYAARRILDRPCVVPLLVACLPVGHGKALDPHPAPGSRSLARGQSS